MYWVSRERANFGVFGAYFNTLKHLGIKACEGKEKLNYET